MFPRSAPWKQSGDDKAHVSGCSWYWGVRCSVCVDACLDGQPALAPWFAELVQSLHYLSYTGVNYPRGRRIHKHILVWLLHCAALQVGMPSFGRWWNPINKCLESFVLKNSLALTREGKLWVASARSEEYKLFPRCRCLPSLALRKTSVKFCEDLKLPVMPRNQLGLSASLYLLAEITRSCHGSVDLTRLSSHVWHLDLFVLLMLWVRKGIRSCQRCWGQVASGHHFRHMRVKDLVCLKLSHGKCEGRQTPLELAALCHPSSTAYLFFQGMCYWWRKAEKSRLGNRCGSSDICMGRFDERNLRTKETKIQLQGSWL